MNTFPFICTVKSDKSTQNVVMCMCYVVIWRWKKARCTRQMWFYFKWSKKMSANSCLGIDRVYFIKFISEYGETFHIVLLDKLILCLFSYNNISMLSLSLMTLYAYIKSQLECYTVWLLGCTNIPDLMRRIHDGRRMPSWKQSPFRSIQSRLLFRIAVGVPPPSLLAIQWILR